MTALARTFERLGLAPLPRPVYGRNERQPSPVVVEERRPLPKRHHPNLDATAIKVRAGVLDFTGKGLCYCCEAASPGAWLCGDCAARGCGGAA